MKRERSRRAKGYRGMAIYKNTEPQRRLMVGIPMTGNLRCEWHLAKTQQVIPCNWSQQDFVQFVDQYSPIKFMVADARNIIAQAAVRENFEWLLFIDHDVCLPPLFMVTINDYMIRATIPIFGGLYFTKSVPSEPLVYRGRGTGYYADWKIGDKVWVDGMGMGATVIHVSILRALYEESEEYTVAGETIRRVFETPSRVFYDPESKSFHTQIGTEDLEFCSRIMRDGIFEKAGWPKYAKKRFPFMIDTKLFCWHIDENGIKYPAKGENLRFVRKKKEKKK